MTARRFASACPRLAALLLLGVLEAHGQPGDPAWVDRSSCKAPLSAEAAEHLIDWVRQARPGAVQAAADPAAGCLLFLSLGSPDGPASTVLGTGVDPAAAVADALFRLRPDFRKLPWIRLDLVDELVPVGDEPGEDPGNLYGLATGADQRIALLPDELAGWRLLSRDGVLVPERFARFLLHNPQRGFTVATGQAQLQEHPAPAWRFRFTTQAWFSAGGPVTRLYRGHEANPSMQPDDLLHAVQQGGDYLLRMLDADGKFVYIWSALQNRGGGGYNILRHAGTTYSLLQVYQATGDAKYLQAAQSALVYLQRQIRDCPGMPQAACVVERYNIKLGGNGLALVALAEYVQVTGDRSVLKTARRLAEWLLAAVQENGAFVAHQWRYPEGTHTGFKSDYYPGEAILGLLRLYRHDPDSRWLAGAAAAARYLVEVRDGAKTLQQLAHDHWLLYALADLYAYAPDPLYLQHGMRLTRAIQQAQQLRHPEYPDWLGSYHSPPSSTPTATRSEAMLSAWRLLRQAGKQEQLADILRTACLGAHFQLTTRFTPASAMFLLNPAAVLGGFRSSLTGFDIRIDFVQHNISALLGLLEMLEASGDAIAGCQDMD